MGFNCTFCKSLGAKFAEDSSTFVNRSYGKSDSCNWTNCSNLVILTKTKNISFPNHNGSLSIKYPLKGGENYEIQSDRNVKVDFSNFLILNAHQNYASEFYSNTDNEILCIFFQENYVRKMLGSAFQNTSEMLGNFECLVYEDFVFDTLHKKSPEIDIIMRWFRRYLISSKEDQFSFQHKFVELFYHILYLNLDLVKLKKNLKYQKKSTRDEIYRRLQKGREYIESNFANKIKLDEIADSSNLSLFHFVRKFKELFGVSPHYYLSRKRVDHAAYLLKNNYSVTEACYSSGFIDSAHFSKAFKQIKKESPLAYKKRFKKSNF